jgi:DNA helicase II / ATP-dependent DNA helicase PcrA
MELKDLNKEQQEAVLYKSGPLLIVAGAGTGKTTVITRRIAHLIEQGVNPQEILGVTFTDKAAGEMEERVDRLLPFGYLDLWISTFHAFCERVLKEHGIDIGLPTDFKLVNQTTAWLMIRNNIDKFDVDYYKPMGNPTKFVHAMISHFSRLKDEAIYPEEYLDYAKNFKGEEIEKKRIKEIANAYDVYQKLLLENNCLDFGDLINYCLRLFEERPQILKKYQDQFRYTLVDEFQDTNWAQYELIKKLVADDSSLTVCCDDDQSVFKFRGASTSNVLQFKKDFPNAKNIVLTKNYRSYQEILDLSYNFIQHNNPDRLEFQEKIDKRLIANKKGKADIKLLHFKTLQKEISGIADEILNLDTDLSSIAILIRANSAADILSKELERRGISYEFLASKGLYSKPIVLDLIAYLKIVNNSFESSSLNRILHSSFLSISFEDLSLINQYSKKRGISTYETLRMISLVKELQDSTYGTIELLMNLIKRHSKLKKTSHVFIDFINESGYLKQLVKEHDEPSIDLIGQFYKKIKAFEETSDSLYEFIEQIDLELEAGDTGSLDYELELSPDTVKIMTIHSAKGLEFDYVFIPNLVDKRFPTIRKGNSIKIPDELVKEVVLEGDAHLQEERRLFYVALTRARKGLFLTYADDYGGTRVKKPSRFITELSLEQLDIEAKEDLKKQESKEVDYRGKIPTYFSYSQLAAFSKCPLQYKFAHVLKIPRRGSYVFSFGKTIHNVLYKYLNLEQDNIGEKELLELYKKEFIDEWYQDDKQRKEYFDNGKEILKKFLKTFLKEKPEIYKFEDKLSLELNFKTKFNDNLFIGTIDRIDIKDGELEIIDYKTGKSKDKLTKDDKEQLLIYQLATNNILGIMPSRMSYYYLDGNQQLGFSSSEEEREEVKEKLVKTIKEIKNSKFEACPGFQCKFCDFKDICEFRKL